MPAPEIEAEVVQALRQSEAAPIQAGDPVTSEVPERDLIERLVEKIIVRPKAIEIIRSEADPGEPLLLPWSPPPVRIRREITLPGNADHTGLRPIRSGARARLVEGIAKARLWLDELVAGRVTDTQEIAEREGISDRSVRMMLNLAFLSPQLVKAAVEGKLPHGSGISRLFDLPACWNEQVLGFHGLCSA